MLSRLIRRLQRVSIEGRCTGFPGAAKDLFGVKGYRTTWGAGGFEEQKFDYDATVVARLDEAGAILIAKLSMGALAQGDLWFGARTNPWNKRQGSSGSSAGKDPAAAAALLEDLADRALARSSSRCCAWRPEPARRRQPAARRRASVYQRHGGVRYATRAQLAWKTA